MKNQESGILPEDLQIQNKNSSNLSKQIYCKYNKLSTLACINKKCLKNAFICQDKQCSCRSQHQNCLLVKNQSLSSSLCSKKISCQPLQTLFCQFIDTFIDKLSQFRDSIQNRLRSTKISCIGQVQEEFLQKLKQANVKQVTGKEIWQVCFSNEEQELVEKKFSKNCQYIKEYLKQFDKERILLCEKIEHQLKSFEYVKESYLFQNSDIVRDSQESVDLQQFFEPEKSITEATLIFRASEHNFSVQKFHEICHHVTNILVLCWTQGDKKIGGYTPLPWLGMVGRYATDQSKQSFTFSLTQKDKFQLRQKGNAIYYYNDTSFAFSFGCGADFKISNHADKNSNSRTKINTSYFNNDYQDEDPESYEKFCGNSSSYFKVKQWEVWKLYFGSKDE